MVDFFSGIKTSLIITGAIIGAGYLSGAELVGFFGQSNFLIFLPVSGVFLFFFIYILLRLGAKVPSFPALNERVFGKEKAVDYFFYLCSFISLSSFLAGINELTLPLLNTKIPVFSSLFIAVCVIIFKSGLKGIKLVNLILTPVIIIIIVFLCVYKNRIVISVDKGYNKNLIKSLLFSTSNVFLLVPVIMGSGKSMNKRSAFFASLFSATITVFLSVVILGVIKGGGEIKNIQMPILGRIDKRFSFLFNVLLFSGIITSALSVFFPLYAFFKKKGKIFAISLCVFSVCFSEFGIFFIVKYFYPLSGVIGLVFMIFYVGYYFRIKRKEKRIISLKRR